MIQQHINGSDVFNRSWQEYKLGFNDSNGNFWLGNELLHQLTKHDRYKLRFDLRQRVANSWYWAEYSTFMVTSEETKYLMRVDGHSGDWTKVFIHHDGAMFTTYDSDNDEDSTRNCAVTTGGGFWWKTCFYYNGVNGVNTPLSSSLKFRYKSSSSVYNLLISRMWLTC